jgi:hypothetical protein
MDVSNANLFKEAFHTLNGKTHGDTLAVYLALKYHQHTLPSIATRHKDIVVSDAQIGLPTLEGVNKGVTSSILENLLDSFYTKRHSSLGQNNGRVCRIFNGTFTPLQSHSQNNWRDFFRYALGISCLASEEELLGDFVAEHRSLCKHLIQNDEGALGCELHPLRTKYIRGLHKPKLLHWKLSGHKGVYKTVDLNNPLLEDVIRPFSSRVPLDSLITTLYFGSAWNTLSDISVERFVSDFNFESIDQVEHLFAVDFDDPATQRKIKQVKREIASEQTKPFSLVGSTKTYTSTIEKKIRTRAFTEAVREAYNFACAVCGLKYDSPSGKWEVQAAHVYPKELFGIDDVRNGLALCRTHHWAFDQFAFTIDTSYKLLWHPNAKGTSMYKEGSIALPIDQRMWPNQDEALAWHRSRFSAQNIVKDKGKRKKSKKFNT